MAVGTKVGGAYYELDADASGVTGALKRADAAVEGSATHAEQQIGGRFGGAFGKAQAGASALQAKVGGLPGPVKAIGGAFIGTIGAMAAFEGAGALIQGFASSVDLASDRAESLSKVGVLFGPAAGQVKAFAETSATSLGISQNAALDATGTFGNLFTALKIGNQPAADMSVSLVKLAGDMASFNNADPSEVLEAIRSGLVGEAEPLRRFGVNMNEATLATKAMEMGLISNVKQGLTPAQKAQAAYGLIMEQTAAAQGDFARTSGGLANQQRINAARMEDAMTSLGETLMPIAQAIVPLLANALIFLVDVVKRVVTFVGDLFNTFKPLIDILLSLIGLALTPTRIAFEMLGQIIGWLMGVLAPLGDVFSQVFNGIAKVVGDVVSTIIGAVRNLVDIASQIPGPWQESAKALKVELDKMQSDVDSWGEATAADAGAMPIHAAERIEANAGLVGPATEDAVSKPMVAAAAQGRKDAVAEVRKTPAEMAAALLDERFNVEDAAASIVEAQETTLSRTKEIAALEGFLTGKALRDALADSRPEVRAQAEAWKQDAEDRLFALKNGVRELALQTGMNYADALALRKAQVGAAARVQVDAAENEYIKLRSGAKGYGSGVGQTFAQGIESQGTYLYNAVHRYLGKARVQMMALSPPKEGPLHEIDRFGRKTAETYADEWAGAGPYLGRRVGEFLMGARAVIEPRGFGMPAPVPVVGTPGGGRSVTINGGIHVTLPGGTPRKVGEAVVDEIRYALHRI